MRRAAIALTLGQVAFASAQRNLEARSFGNSDSSPPILREATLQDVGVSGELDGARWRRRHSAQRGTPGLSSASHCCS